MKFINSLKNENSRDASRSVFLRGKIFLVCSVFFFGVMLTACPLSGNAEKQNPGKAEKPEMLSFQFRMKENKGLKADLEGVISNGLITFNIPDGELGDFQGAFSSLTPVFTVSKGAAVTVGEDRQVSGTSSLDFTAPAIYTVKAPDGRKKLYEASFKSGTLAYIPDSNFRSLLQDQEFLTFSGDWLNTATSTLESLTSLKDGGGGMDSVQGIQYFSSLEELELTKSPLLTIDLSKNNLETLILKNTKLYDLDVSASTKLLYFIVHDDTIKELHFTHPRENMLEMAFRGLELEVIDIRGVTSLHVDGYGFTLSPPGFDSITVSATPKLRLFQLNSAMSRTAGYREVTLAKTVIALKKIYGEDLTIEVYSSTLDADGKPVYKLEDEDHRSDIGKTGRVR